MILPLLLDTLAPDMCPGNPVAGGETPALPCLIVTLELVFCFRPFVLLIHRRAEGLHTPCWLDSFQFFTAFPEADEVTGKVTMCVRLCVTRVSDDGGRFYAST